MKFKRTLHINKKEINILFEAVKMYRAHMGIIQTDSKLVVATERLQGYRNKLLNMEKILSEMKSQESNSITESKIYE